MRFKSMFLMLLASLFFVSVLFAADVYQIDPAHSSIAFSVRHLVISNVSGKFNEFSGTIFYDEQDFTKSTTQVNITTASIDTDNERRDNHLRGADFFETEKYPAISYKSKRIEKRDNGYVAVGDLFMHGVAKEIEIQFSVVGKIVDPWGKTRIGLEGSATLDRNDFGLTWSQTMDNGGLVLGNKIKITLNVEAVKQ